MRIIGGHNKGAIIQAPKNLPVRPTTDRAKESLFNILNNLYNFNTLHVLDLFAGTGNITYEFASRGALSVVCVDKSALCVDFIKLTCKKYHFNSVAAIKADAFAYLKNCLQQFDIIFADAPYALVGIKEIPFLVQQKKLLKPGGKLIVEHASALDLKAEPDFKESRKYGQTTFSFFL